MTITTGTTVKVTNHDQVQHTWTSVAGPTSWHSGVLNPGGSFSVTFTKAGSYSYKCSIHPFMTGTITVVA
jgi:plastocyanin